MIINYTCREIAEIIDAKLVGADDDVVTGLNRLEFADNGDITFLSDSGFEKYLESTQATAIIISDKYDFTLYSDKNYLIVDNPYQKFVYFLRYIEANQQKNYGTIHPAASISESAKISPSASIGAFCSIGENVIIGDFVIVHPGAVLYDNVKIGERTTIHSNVVCYSDTIIGSGCVIHAGAVLGSDGFGFTESSQGEYTKIPQLGNVVLMDDVEIGANTTIDRSMVGSTIIERGVKIDNLVQVAHNVIVGEHTGIAAQAGIAGTVKVGKRNRFGGQVGLAGHMETADDVILLAQSGVPKSIQQKGVYFGSPAREVKKAFKIEAVIRNLPELYDDLNRLKKIVAEK